MLGRSVPDGDGVDTEDTISNLDTIGRRLPRTRPSKPIKSTGLDSVPARVGSSAIPFDCAKILKSIIGQAGR
jgi:hypothetical protein